MVFGVCGFVFCVFDGVCFAAVLVWMGIVAYFMIGLRMFVGYVGCGGFMVIWVFGV